MSYSNDDLEALSITGTNQAQLDLHVYSSTEETVAAPVMRPKRHQVKNACRACQTSCKKCDDSRPCLRCVKYGMGDQCVSSVRKPRTRGSKRGPYKKRDGTPCDESSAIESPVDFKPVVTPINPAPAAQPAAQASNFAVPVYAHVGYQATSGQGQPGMSNESHMQGHYAAVYAPPPLLLMPNPVVASNTRGNHADYAPVNAAHFYQGVPQYMPSPYFPVMLHPSSIMAVSPTVYHRHSLGLMTEDSSSAFQTHSGPSMYNVESEYRYE